MCVCILPQISSMHSACAMSYCHLWPIWLYRIFPHYLINRTILGKKRSWMSSMVFYCVHNFLFVHNFLLCSQLIVFTTFCCVPNFLLCSQLFIVFTTFCCVHNFLLCSQLIVFTTFCCVHNFLLCSQLFVCSISH